MEIKMLYSTYFLSLESPFIYILGKKDLNLQIHNHTKKKFKKRTKLKDKISSYFFRSIPVCLISSYFHCLLPIRFKVSHQELSKYIKGFQRTFGKEKF